MNNILLDDEKHIRELYNEELTDAGYDVILYDRANGCIDKIINEEPDHLVLDLKSPRIGTHGHNGQSGAGE